MLLFSVLVICNLGGAMQIPGKKGEHSCAMMNAQNKNHSGCENNTRECPVEKCSEEHAVHGCITMYKNVSGTMKPVYMGCWDVDRYGGCGTEICSLEYHNEHYSCCCFESMCNLNITLKYDVTTTPSPTMSPKATRSKRAISNDSMLLVYILAPLFSFIIIFGILAHFLIKRKDSTRRENDLLLEPQQTHSPIMHCRPIQILGNIHRGQFANVSKALYQHKIVAVKDIQSSHEELWTNERHIYEKCNLDHDNVLQFIGAEKRCLNGAIQYWIITEFCNNGSLADHLQKYTVTISELISMTLCILKGLVYLHCSSSAHPTIAHRDLKSSNIFVKSDLTCCIGDFGLSISFTPESTNISSEMSQVGTKRYMAPEILRGAIAYTPECFLSIDIYAFALVCWELLSRCAIAQDSPDPYMPPYCNEVGYHPSLEDMIRCVVEENKRPQLKDEWRSHEILGVFSETIEECWDVDAYARVAANLALLRLSKLILPESSCGEKISNSISKEREKVVESSDESIEGITVLLTDKV